MGSLNLAVLLAFIVNTAFTFLSQIALPYNNGELSRKYQSLVTPSGWAFAIWGVIFTLEACYAAAQLLPALRDAEEVKRAGPWFVVACLAQAGWSVAFGYELIYLSLGLILGILLSLAGANAALQTVTSDHASRSWLRYALFVLPLTIHFGWLTAASVVAANLTLVSVLPSAHTTLLAVAVGSLVLLLLPALSNRATASSGSDPAYALTVAWALAGVAVQLNSPMQDAPAADPIPSWCPSFVTDALAIVAAALAATIVCVTIVRPLTVLACSRSASAKSLTEGLIHVHATP